MRGSKELLRSLRGLAHLVTSQGTNIIVGGTNGPVCFMAIRARSMMSGSVKSRIEVIRLITE